jgi:hypothetical protein
MRLSGLGNQSLWAELTGRDHLLFSDLSSLAFNHGKTCSGHTWKWEKGQGRKNRVLGRAPRKASVVGMCSFYKVRVITYIFLKTDARVFLRPAQIIESSKK